MKTKLRLVLAFPLLFFCFSLWSQDSGGPWQKIEGKQDALTLGIRDAEGYLLETSELGRTLEAIQVRPNRSAIVSFPDGEGGIMDFQVEEHSVMHPELQARYPSIRSYRGFALNDPKARQIRFSFSPEGFQGMLLSASGSGDLFMEQIPEKPGRYVVFSRKEREENLNWKCETESRIGEAGLRQSISAAGR